MPWKKRTLNLATPARSLLWMFAAQGLTPVANQSGKHRAVHVRWASNKRFR